MADGFMSITLQEAMLTGAQNNRKLWLMFCIIEESNSQKTFFSFVLYTNNINVNLLLVQRCQVKNNL